MGFKLPWWAKAWLFLVCWPSAVLAADVFRITDPTGKVEVQIILRDSACVDKNVLEYLHEGLLDDRRFKKAEMEWKGEGFGACWVELHGQVFTIGSDKEPLRPIPREAFKDDSI